MPNYLEYRRSISNELISIKDRVRNFIEDNHWGEDGRYKEIILSEILKNLLPQNVTVATGFILGKGNQVSNQIDIIIFKNDYPVLFKMANFVVVAKESVVGIIEVKSKIDSSNIKEAIEKSHNNGKLVGNHIFNGIFGYETGFSFNGSNILSDSIKDTLQKNYGYLNNVCFGKDYFMKHWDTGNPRVTNKVKCYSLYEIKDLSFGYFISNLIKVNILANKQKMGDIMKSSLFPIGNNKEEYKLEDIEIKFLDAK